MTKELEQSFVKWWDSGKLLEDNPYTAETPMWWAWEGYVAGVSATTQYVANRSTILMLKP